MNAREGIVLAAGRLLGEELLETPADAERSLERFGEIYRHAYENIPYYRRKYESVGLPARLSGDSTEVRRVPPLAKEELRSRRLVPAESRFSVRLRSGGTVGAISSTYLGPGYVLKRYGMLLRILYALGWEMGRPIAALHPVEYRFWSNLPSMLRRGETSQALFEFVQQYVVYRLFHNRRNVYYSGDVFELGGRGLLDRALRGGPSLVISRPDVLSALVKDDGAGARLSGTSVVMLVGSLAVASAMDRVRDFFGCRVVNMYASTEAGYIGLGCPFSGDRVHVDEAAYMVEIDADRDGEVLVTDFNNWGMPIIRYRTGDVGEASVEACPCGRRGLLLRIRGRKDSFLVNERGRKLFDADVMGFFERAASLRAYQLESAPGGGLLLRLRSGQPVAAERLLDEFCERFSFDRGRARCDLAAPLRRSSSGKLQCIL